MYGAQRAAQDMRSTTTTTPNTGDTAQKISPRATIVKITPEMAEQILRKQNNMNRPVRPRVVESYARDLREGRWELNGEAIVFAEDRTLLNGQHRLMAIIKSGVAMKTWVIIGVDKKAFQTFDTHSRRTHSDVNYLKHAERLTGLSATARALFNYEKDRHPFAGQSVRITSAELQEFIDNEHPNIRKSVSAIYKGKPYKNKVNPCAAALCHYLFSKVDEALAQDFFDKLFSGLGFDETHPIYNLREKLISLKGPATAGRKKVEMIMMIKTWNAIRSGGKGRRYRVPNSRDTIPAVQ